MIGRHLSALVALILATAVPAAAQELTLRCSGDLDTACTARVAPTDSLQRANVVVQVTQGAKPVAGALVRFRPSSGTLADSSISDASGYVRTVWTRTKGADDASIAMDARTPIASGVAYARLTPYVVKRKPVRIEMRNAGGFRQSWFEKSQLPHPVEVELLVVGEHGERSEIGEDSTCTSNRVLFRTHGAAATVSPDTAVAKVDSRHCYASTFWSLGEGIGERTLDVALLPGKGYQNMNTLEAEAWARATPRFVAGFAVSRLKPYLGLNPAGTRTVKIERVDANGVTRSYDTTETTGAPSVSRVAAKTEFSAVVGVSVPIPIARFGNWDDLSLTAGADLAKPRDRVFAGISLLRLFGRLNPVIESLPIDLHVLGLWAKQPELQDARCEPAACKTKDRTRFQGPSVMLSADAATLVSDLVKKLAP